MRPARDTPAWPRRRRWPLATLGLGVTLAHLWAAGRWLPARLGEGAADGRPRRIEVSFVRELQPAEPVPVSAPPPPAAPRRLARTLPGPAAAASAGAGEPLTPGLTPLLPAPDAPLASGEMPSLLGEPLPAILELPPSAVAAAPAASAPQPFEWPPSTRLSYTLSGQYRGPVEGRAQVEWLRKDQRYQVHMDVTIGPPFAPLMSRRVSSEGDLTPQGLRPLRYDEATQVAWRDARRYTVWMEGPRVRFADGSEQVRPADVQDSASQFVQLTWMYTMQPELLQAGRSVQLQLAMQRRLQAWTYEVQGTETLHTPAGPVSAVHVKPRREARPGGDLSAEMWFAPTLQYLPVRIIIRQDEQTYIDLLIERLPEQAAPAR